MLMNVNTDCATDSPLFVPFSEPGTMQPITARLSTAERDEKTGRSKYIHLLKHTLEGIDKVRSEILIERTESPAQDS